MTVISQFFLNTRKLTFARRHFCPPRSYVLGLLAAPVVKAFFVVFFVVYHCFLCDAVHAVVLTVECFVLSFCIIMLHN